MTVDTYFSPIKRTSSILGHPKYRHKEEKKKLLKICVRKLRNMEDPEVLLCKAVLINNTLKHLQSSHYHTKDESANNSVVYKNLKREYHSNNDFGTNNYYEDNKETITTAATDSQNENDLKCQEDSNVTSTSDDLVKDSSHSSHILKHKTE